MNKFSTIIWMVVIVVAVFMLYKVKYEVQALKTQVAETSRELENEREALHVVAAEWAYLNRPERLRVLATKYLSSTGVTVDQIADVEMIPFPNRSVASADHDDSVKPVSAKMPAGGVR